MTLGFDVAGDTLPESRRISAWAMMSPCRSKSAWRKSLTARLTAAS
jgi:hypothetical protein